MNEEKGVLSSQLEELAAKAGDGALVLKGVWEMVDGPAILTSIRLIDNNLGEKVKDPLKTEIREMLDEVLIEKNPDAACQIFADYMDSLVDIPGLDDASEQMIFRGAMSIVAGWLAKIVI